jgi:O2-independent ubiquinone biosynthesis accessory factor UbiT
MQILGFALRPLPVSSLQPLLNHALKTMQQRHSDVFERLSPLGSHSFLIDTTDLPFSFLLRPSGDTPTLTAIQKPIDPDTDCSAIIRGPLLSLLALLEGQVDGDALFFSRALVIEGDTEAVLTLRNAIDGAHIDLFQDALSQLGPLAGPASKIAHFGDRIYGQLTQDLETLARSSRAPLSRNLQAQAADIRDLDERLDDVTRQLRRALKSKR